LKEHSVERLSFVEHPASVGETYTQHLRSAWSFSLGMLVGGIACFIHGLLPFFFVTTGSSMVRRLHDRMVVNRRRPDATMPCRSQAVAALAAAETKTYRDAAAKRASSDG
jgi:Family of unknown function (DUF6356)